MSVKVYVAVMLLSLLSSIASAQTIRKRRPVTCTVSATAQALSAASAYEIDQNASEGGVVLLRVTGSWTGYPGATVPPGVVWVDGGTQAAAVQASPFTRHFIVNGTAHEVLLTLGPAPFRCMATAAVQ